MTREEEIREALERAKESPNPALVQRLIAYNRDVLDDVRYVLERVEELERRLEYAERAV